MKKIILLTALFSIPSFLFSQTLVSGNLSGTWTTAGNPYLIAGNVFVIDSLIIQPGVIVQFHAGGLSIEAGTEAKLKAIGTEAMPIVLEPILGTNSGSFKGIVLTSSGNDDILEHCIIRYGTIGINAYDSSPLINNCEVYRNSEYGIKLDYHHDPQNPLISHCTIYENGMSGILFGGYDRYGAVSATGRIDRCVIFNNEQNGVIIWSGTYWNWGNAYAQAQISNCVIVGNSTGIRAYAYRGYADAKILNTIIAYNTDYAILNQDGAAHINANDIIHNAFWMNSPENFSTIQGTGFGEPGNYTNNNGDACDINFNIYYDPLFIEPTEHNYCVDTVYSKCIDAGTSIIFDSIVIDSNGSLPDIGICSDLKVNTNELTVGFEKGYSLYQNYSNPFTTSTSISYVLYRPALVELTIYNTSGQEVTTLVNERQLSGEYQVLWNGKRDNNAPIPNGVYWYHLQVDSHTQSKKMVLLK